MMACVKARIHRRANDPLIRLWLQGLAASDG